MATGRRPGPVGQHDGWGEPTYRHGASGPIRAGVSAPSPIGSVGRSHQWHPPAISAVRGRRHRRSVGPISAAPPAAHAVKPAAKTGGLDYDQVYEDLKPYEGFCKFMYLDTASPPKVTVGVGNMLPDAASAQKLPFINAATNKPATPDEIASAFNKVAAMKGSMGSDKYKQSPSIEISEDQAKSWAIGRLKGEFVPKLKHLFKDFDSFPLPAKEALIDMIYNMGIGYLAYTDKKGDDHKARGLMSYQNLVKAVKGRDWKTAAEHCARTPSNKKHPQNTIKRNNWTKQRFLDADLQDHPKQIDAPAVSP